MGFGRGFPWSIYGDYMVNSGFPYIEVPQELDGLVGKSQSKMDNDWGVPPRLRKPPYGYWEIMDIKGYHELLGQW